MKRRTRRRRAETGALRGIALIMNREGKKVRAARLRRKWTQAQLGLRVGLSQTAISKMELGDGATLSVAAWQRVADALDLPLELRLGRDAQEETTDAGHLQMQELMLRLGRKVGYQRTFELPSKPSDPTAWVDVGLVDRARRRLVLNECVNSMGDMGAATRSSDRKERETKDLAVALGGEDPYSVHVVWVMRATRRNRALVRRYPELFATRFPGSSVQWVRALTEGADPPSERGLVCADVKCTRLFPWRQRPPSRLHKPAHATQPIARAMGAVRGPSGA